MRYRAIPFLLFVVVLIVPLALRWASGITTAKRATGSDRIIVITPHAEAIRSEFAFAFSNWHEKHYGSPVFIDYRIYGGATDITRFFDSARSTLFASLHTYNIDIVWGGGDDLFENGLRKPGYLQGVALDESVMRKAFAQREINGLELYDTKSQPPQWFGTALSSFGIVYNRDVLAHLGLPEPKTWRDLIDPKYAGWLVLADPTRSGVARTAFMVIVERAMQDAADAHGDVNQGWARGMGMIRQIAANARMFTDNGSIVPAIVSSGDAAAGMAIDFQARSQVDAVAVGSTSRLGYVEPVGATAINPDPVAMVAGAPHPELAKHFIEYLLSEEGQRLWITRAGAPGGPRQTSLRRLPIMKSVYDSPTNFTDTVNPYVASAGFNTRPDRSVTAPIVASLVQMSCIDLLDDLRTTRRTVLNSRATELDAKLGTFPFDQREAIIRAKNWRASTSLQRLDLQREWTQEFRTEYANLRNSAKN